MFSNSVLNDESSLNFARVRLACVMVGGNRVTESKGVDTMWNVRPSYGASCFRGGSTHNLQYIEC